MAGPHVCWRSCWSLTLLPKATHVKPWQCYSFQNMVFTQNVARGHIMGLRLISNCLQAERLLAAPRRTYRKGTNKAFLVSAWSASLSAQALLFGFEASVLLEHTPPLAAHPCANMLHWVHQGCLSAEHTDWARLKVVRAASFAGPLTRARPAKRKTSPTF